MHFLRDLPLAGFNSFGVCATARQFANVSSEIALMNWCAAHGRDTPPFLLGGGSNLLLTRDIESPVLQIAPRGARIVWDEGSTVLVVLNGISGPIKVKGASYDGTMPSFSHLSDAEIAATVNFVRGAWGNQSAAAALKPVTAKLVGRLRAQPLSPTEVHARRAAAD